MLAPTLAARAEEPLRWGGDKAGGSPFIFERDGKDVGFEADIAAILGTKLGRAPEFVQGPWDSIPDGLARGEMDIALNGYEYTRRNARRFACTIPYYVYTLRLVVRVDETRIAGWDDLKKTLPGGKLRVGVLRGSVAQRYMMREFADSIEIVPANEVAETFKMVEIGDRLDATVQDSPSSSWFVGQGRIPLLKIIDEPRGKGYYTVLVRREDAKLRDDISAVLREIRDSGQLAEIFKTYGIDTPEQADLKRDDIEPAEEVGVTLHSLADKLFRATLMTVALACLAMPLAILLGVLIAVGRMYGPQILRAPLTLYVEIVRGTPLLLQLYVLFFLLPEIARDLEWGPLIWLATPSAFVVGVVGLAINYSANEAENYRAGILAIPRGQMEAGLALGMTPYRVVRRIVLPQAMRIVIPSVTNDFIALFKDTSVCSVILITELTGLYYQYKWDSELAQELALTVAVIYFGLSYPLSLLARRLERKPGE